MRKYKSAYLKPYIRRAKKQDFNGTNAIDFRTAILMALLKEIKNKNIYVLVQRGSNKVLTLSTSKYKLKNKYAVVWVEKKHKSKRFNKWCNDIKHYCRKH